ncbi:hypothetical protein [Streptomyces sp. NPDC059247]|uniref:hypothetical protein n=1 Tax=Streptomyces sp. NPDC059247 TaxID=3346790 RepID=UPI0036BF8BD8
MDPAAAITADTLHKSFQGTGVSMQTARQDRILHEAFETEDPLHLIRLFGISAAHPNAPHVSRAEQVIGRLAVSGQPQR